MYKFHYGFLQPIYGSEVRLCYMHIDNFLFEIETEDFYRDIPKDVEAKFDTNKFSEDDNKLLQIGKNKNSL